MMVRWQKRSVPGCKLTESVLAIAFCGLVDEEIYLLFV